MSVVHGLFTSDCKTETPKRFSWDNSNTVFSSGKGFGFDEIEEVPAGLLVLAEVCVLLFGQTRIDTKKSAEAGLEFGFMLITSKKALGGSDRAAASCQ